MNPPVPTRRDRAADVRLSHAVLHRVRNREPPAGALLPGLRHRARLRRRPCAAERGAKIITAIFVDLVGSTARSEQLDPEDVKALVAPYHARVRAELERHGGTFEKFSGDAVLALFGAPKAHEDDPERAIRAAFAVAKGIAELNAEDEWLDLQIRVGIHTGEALVMLGARPSEGEWSAAGDVLNTAARIQSAAPRDGILVGRATYLATGTRSSSARRSRCRPKARASRSSVWEVVAAARRSPPRPKRRRRRFVGREEELDELLGFCTACGRAPRGHRTIVGSPGIGKSRLLHELVAPAEGARNVHWGRCLSYGEGITYWPVTEIVKSAAGILQSDDRETVAARLDTFLEGLATEDVDELRTIAAGALEPHRDPDNASRHLHHQRDLAGRAPLGHPARLAAPRRRAADRGRSSKTSTGPSRRCSS